VDITIKMTLQYGLRIIFDTQLSHKTKRGQMTEVRKQITDVKGQEGQKTDDFEGGFRNAEGGI
jgi:hypothetical protein